jgi:hypothetical protein
MTDEEDKLLRASVPERWKGTTSPIGAVQNYIAELERALGMNAIREVLTNVQNGIDSPAMKEMANYALRRIDATL